MTSRAVDRDLKREVTVNRPSRSSNVRVFRGVSMRAVTRVRRVADWIAGQLTGSRRSKRSFEVVNILIYNQSKQQALYKYLRSCSAPLQSVPCSEDVVTVCLG